MLLECSSSSSETRVFGKAPLAVGLAAVVWMLVVSVSLVAAWRLVASTDEGNFAQPSFHLAWNGKFATPTVDPSA
jgi:hypothetical protein